MGEFLGFIVFWLFIMALIGLALKIVAVIGNKKNAEKSEEKSNTEDIADE